jgi:hypothetical protein
MRKVLLGLSVVLALLVLVSSVSAITILPIAVYVDIKPESWPNPFQLMGGGLLPVAICGTEEFDVTHIDPASIELTKESWGIGVSPLRWSWEDVATPYTLGELFGGHDLGPDGFLDLTLKFKIQEVIDTLDLGDLYDRDVIMLMITGNLKEEYGGTPIEGEDCIMILRKHIYS